MSVKIEEWLERLRAAKNPGPVVRITVVRNGRDVGWSYDLDEDTDLTQLAERIDNAARGVGYPTCELRAFDDQGRFILGYHHQRNFRSNARGEVLSAGSDDHDEATAAL